MKLTDHDEFLHLGYPRDSEQAWKENYYFNYIDTAANAMGIFHASILRHKKAAKLSVFNIIDGEIFKYSKIIPWPTANLDPLDEQLIIGDEKLSIKIIEPFKQQQVTFDDGDTSIQLNFRERFPAYLYEHKENQKNDKTMDTTHYEQGLFVEGEVSYKGKSRTINCLGHRDHTWGYRDEEGILGWNWIAIQCENSTWNFTELRRSTDVVRRQGFISRADGAEAICDVSVEDIEYDQHQEPIVSQYRVSTENGDIYHLTATRFACIPMLNVGGTTMSVYENIADFVIEETGERGTGIDEHVIIGTTTD